MILGCVNYVMFNDPQSRLKIKLVYFIDASTVRLLSMLKNHQNAPFALTVRFAISIAMNGIT